jgi:hypothetical protein
LGNLVEDFILSHTIPIRVSTKANYDQAVFLGEDGLVDMPACSQVGKDCGAHGGDICGRSVDVVLYAMFQGFGYVGGFVHSGRRSAKVWLREVRGV